MAGSSESSSVLTTTPPGLGNVTGSAVKLQSARTGSPTGRRARRIWWLVVLAREVIGAPGDSANGRASCAGEKKPRRAAVSFPEGAGRSELRSGEDANVRGLQALLALLHFEFDALVFGERLEAVALDVTEVGEEVGAARVLRDEAEALALVEPLHGSGLGRHNKCPVYDEMNAQQHAARAATL